LLSSSSCFFPLCVKLLFSSLPYVVALLFALLFSSPCRTITLFFAPRCCYLLHIMLLFSSSRHTIVLLFMLHYYYPLCNVVVLFTLLFSSLCTITLFFALLLFYFRYKVFHVAFVVGVLLFIEESCTTPLHSFLQELGVIRS
jgi:hypothetical protein